ncbi:hypothetical protein QJS04_geneDACA020640 [Acorus gramineus]|uniref:VLRF1 domain-containing protein n=1 Tax=Acorus gramineus TaxID=55184 RepID=A0AAV9BCZ4_ACOGR|nr:hypothetical protein QJS04_geneDACA020640 [Acorus gramineus]
MAAKESSPRIPSEPKSRSLFDLLSDFFDSSSLLSFLPDPKPPQTTEIPTSTPPSTSDPLITIERSTDDDVKDTATRGPRWSCNTCRSEFDSLGDQRSHFQSDFHRFNIKLSIAGREVVNEEDFDELNSDSLFDDYDISSISGSEDESESSIGAAGRPGVGVKAKLYIRLRSGDVISIWKCLVLNESEELSLENQTPLKEHGGVTSRLSEFQLIERLRNLVREPRDKTRLRIVLLVGGGHFAGCVFDGNSVVAHKTFHRYVIRAKAGKRQSAKDGTGKAAKSAGSSLRRYNEIALKKEVQELLLTWKPYFDSSSCIFVHAPSSNRQLLFDGDKLHCNCPDSVIRHVPLTVRRPTLKEVKRIYHQLTNVTNEEDEKVCESNVETDLVSSGDIPDIKNLEIIEDQSRNSPKIKEDTLVLLNDSTPLHIQNLEAIEEQSRNQPEIKDSVLEDSNLLIAKPNKKQDTGTPVLLNDLMPLHEAAKSGNAQWTLELLEHGSDPCIKDVRGRTPYMLATDKEVRNTFRRFMALNLDKWDWHAAQVPSPLTKEMEEAQAAKQAEKDAKRKAKLKELKKLRKEKEKAQAQAAMAQIASKAPQNQSTTSMVSHKEKPRSSALSSEEELKRRLAEERELRAAAAERRLAALNTQAAASATTPSPSSSAPKPTRQSDNCCACCNESLAGKVPFHRYHYKYCSSSCMHVHREMLEDG